MTQRIGFVIASCGRRDFAGIYGPSSWQLTIFEKLLDIPRKYLEPRLTHTLLVLGDFSAKSNL